MNEVKTIEADKKVGKKYKAIPCFFFNDIPVLFQADYHYSTNFPIPGVRVNKKPIYHSAFHGEIEVGDEEDYWFYNHLQSLAEGLKLPSYIAFYSMNDMHHVIFSLKGENYYEGQLKKEIWCIYGTDIPMEKKITNIINFYYEQWDESPIYKQKERDRLVVEREEETASEVVYKLFEKVTLHQLVEFCRNHYLRVKGTRKELIERIWFAGYTYNNMDDFLYALKKKIERITR